MTDLHASGASGAEPLHIDFLVVRRAPSIRPGRRRAQAGGLDELNISALHHNRSEKALGGRAQRLTGCFNVIVGEHPGTVHLHEGERPTRDRGPLVIALTYSIVNPDHALPPAVSFMQTEEAVERSPFGLDRVPPSHDCERLGVVRELQHFAESRTNIGVPTCRPRDRSGGCQRSDANDRRQRHPHVNPVRNADNRCPEHTVRVKNDCPAERELIFA